LEHTTHSIIHHLTPPVGGPVQIFERTVFERTTSSLRVELLPGLKFTGKSVKKMEFTGKIGKTGKR
jgi:hypothetical protein